MANILVFSEVRGDRPCDASRAVVATARQLATSLGATLYAAASAKSQLDGDPLITELGESGADKVVLITGLSQELPLRWHTHGPPLQQAVDQLRPRLTLFPETPASRALAARLAARTGSLFVADAVFRDSDAGPRLARRVGAQCLHRELTAADAPAIVATMAGCPPVHARGEDDADVILFSGQDSSHGATLLERVATSTPSLEEATVIVCVGAGAAHSVETADKLARLLGGRLAITETLRRRDLTSVDDVVDLAHSRVSPRLYLSVGASGSAAHLAAVASSSTIVAVNSDASAPIFTVADYGVVGDADQVLSDLITAATDRGPS